MSSEPTPIKYQGFPIQQQLQPQQQQQQHHYVPKLPSLNQLNPQSSFAQLSYNNDEKQQQQSQNSNEEEKPIEQQFMKIGQMNNEIDEDEIIRMFRENEKGKEKSIEMKKKTSLSGVMAKKGKRDSRTDNHTNTFSSAAFRQESSLKFISKDSSYKQLKQLGLTAHQLEKIKQLLIIYKIQYRTSMFDQEWQRERYRIKEQLFQQLCVGVFEIKEKGEFQLTLAEREVMASVKDINEKFPKMTYDFGIWKYCRNLALEIQLELFVHFHQKSKIPLSKQYKTQLKHIITNLKDPSNTELRLKLLTKLLNSEQLKTISEIELFTEQKRQQIKQKERKLLAEFSSERDKTIIMVRPQFQDEFRDLREPQVDLRYDTGPSNLMTEAISANKNIQESNMPLPSLKSSTSLYNKYVEQSTINLLDDLISKDHLYKMRERLQQDLKGQTKQRLKKKFLQEFIYDL